MGDPTPLPSICHVTAREARPGAVREASTDNATRPRGGAAPRGRGSGVNALQLNMVNSAASARVQ